MLATPNSPLTRNTRQTLVRTAPNPGPMTLDGTNSYAVGDPASQCVVVVDPGPLAEGHLHRLSAAGRVELVLLTHRHPDHTAGSKRFHTLTGAPVRALDPAFCHGGEPLRDGEVITAAGLSLLVIGTPGHSSDSVCFHLPDDGPTGSLLTGDTILGRGTTIIAYPDGQLREYLASLHRLRDLGTATVLPGHGPVLPNLVEVCDTYIDHRQRRLNEVRAALATLGADATAPAVTDIVYPDLRHQLRRAAEVSVEAQLDYLRA
ncbi:MBL fold metallo-hydrolase [Georgenia sp. 10Sc9-8]|uniref:MBL fold metallo-hydrolase n=1 Tax=Georgenia halotolerans TaxID=3028317 RepID=A0ABT5TXK0_9MICO|nr:MBL fold metallo-hydrolase [Georgenia halotolerans]